MIDRIGSISRHERLIGDLRGERPGPTLVCVGGVHGNEPAGVLALERVVASLAKRGLGCGRLVGVVGNVGALNQGKRYIDRDLNRLWWPRLSGHAPGLDGVPACHEEWEKARLNVLLADVLGEAPRRHYLMDLHTTSSPSAPFAIAGCSELCRDFAEVFELPIVLGLERQLGNTLIDHFIDRGWTAVALEAGQHQDPCSIAFHESLLWSALQELGCVEEDPPAPVLEARLAIRRVLRRVPKAVQVLYRHPVRTGDGFRMEDGLENLQFVSEGQPLARDSEGVITSPASGRLLMPLYQPQGEDGFFIVCDI